MTEEKTLLFVKSKDRSAWLDRLRRDPRVPHSAFRFAYLLAQTANDNGTLSQRVGDIAGRAGVQPQMIIKGIRRLADLEYVSLEPGGHGQPWRVTIRPISIAKRDKRQRNS